MYCKNPVHRSAIYCIIFMPTELMKFDVSLGTLIKLFGKWHVRPDHLNETGCRG